MADNQGTAVTSTSGVQPQLQNSVTPTQAPSHDKMTWLELISIFVTIGMAIVIGIFAGVSAHYQWMFCLAASVGALGGLAHEIAQTGGKILFFERKLDGFYMGSLAGTILGAIAGILAARVLFVDPHPSMTTAQLSYEAFFAGLGLKGVVDAAGGQPVPPGTQSLTPEQILAAKRAINQPQRQPQPGVPPALPKPPAQAPTE